MSSSSSSRFQEVSTDIRVIEENIEGEDFIIGDIHGCCDHLTLVVQQMKEGDRLFIAGDLADRGPKSHEIFQLIWKTNLKRTSAGKKPQIHVARGNHEQAFLDYCVVKRNSDASLTKLISLQNDSLDGNTQADNKSNQDKKTAIELAVDDYDKINTAYLKEVNYLRQLGGEWALNLSKEELSAIEVYLASLPHIIHVEGAQAFNVVHADLPCSQRELNTKIHEGNLSLSAAERYYAMWARPNDTKTPIIEKYTAPDEALTYCGHTIGAGVRPSSNHINLDCGTFFSSCICLIRHHQRSCELIGIGSPENRYISLSSSKSSSPQDLKDQIEIYLDKTKVLSEVYHFLYFQKRLLSLTVKRKNIELVEYFEAEPASLIAYLELNLPNPQSTLAKLAQELPDFEKNLELYICIHHLASLLAQDKPFEIIVEDVDDFLSDNKALLLQNANFRLKNLLKCFGELGAEILDDILFSGQTALSQANTATLFKVATDKEESTKEVPNMKTLTPAND